MCIKDGMNLAVISNNDVMTEVQEYIATVCGFSADIWIGLTWSGVHSKFIWINNKRLSWPVVLPPWFYNEPNCIKLPCDQEGTSHNCVRMSNGSLGWKWRTHACYQKHFAICQSLSSTTRDLSITSGSATTVKSTTIHSPTSTVSVTKDLSSTVKSTTTSSQTTTKSTVAETSPESTKMQSQTQLTTESATTKFSNDTKPTSTIESTKLPLIVTSEFIKLNVESSFNNSTEYTTNKTFFNNNTQICTCKSLSNEMNSPKENYRIDKRQTSSYIRRHSSAYDGRLSSRIIGYTGAAVICAVVLIVVSFDIINLMERNAATKYS
ncbi:unnamed protein product [Mytilus coruscus]|uniref:C-type lectin domain-containing protein n=1 Tax=Mytilus coruscus TaxID=42192 RepID=A0A6J8EHB5_MYTCO|nr:unnamed protein product [Mytilus coruscus]